MGIDTTRRISFGMEQLESLGSKAAETQWVGLLTPWSRKMRIK